MPDLIPLHEQLCFALYSANHAMHRIYKPLLDDLGLTYPQYLVLVALWECDGETVGGLCTKMHLESNTLTPLLKRMATAGLITRTRDRRDERQVRIHLSDTGRALQSRASTIPTCILKSSGLSLQSMVDLQVQIANLRDHLLGA